MWGSHGGGEEVGVGESGQLWYVLVGVVVPVDRGWMGWPGWQWGGR